MPFQIRKQHSKMPRNPADQQDRVSPLKRYNRGTPDLYPHQTEKFFLLLTICPRFVGRAARPRAATLPIIAVHNYASGKAGGRCAPRLVTAVLGLAARGRPAAPDGRAKRSLRQSGGENTGRMPHATSQHGLRFSLRLTKRARARAV